MKILTIEDVRHIIHKVGLRKLFQILTEAMAVDFSRWHDFHLSPRHATHYPHGVIELMPCSDDLLYSFKYVNGHPENPETGRLSVVALGLLSDVSNGYPFMLSEMTILTALRTATTGVLAAKYLAPPNSKKLAVIGTGAQAEFQVLGFLSNFSIEEVYFYDKDAFAMKKFEKNLTSENFQLTACQSVNEAVSSADIIITATAAKRNQCLFKINDIDPSSHIHAMGGDCPGKTELDRELLEQAKIIVEYLPQSLVEGEMQQSLSNNVYAELWELVCNKKQGRVDEQEITLFDSVGFALEDFSILQVFYALAEQYQLGTNLNLIPELDDPKNLYKFIS